MSLKGPVKQAARTLEFGRAEAAELASRYRADLVSYFMRRTCRRDVAEDLAQETLRRLIGARLRTDLENPVGYMFQVAASVLRDSARRDRAREVGRHTALEPDAHVCEQPSPERAAAARERLFLLKAALDDLPEKTRDIFLMNRLEGLSYSQLAKLHGVSASAIEKHMMRAIAHLQRRVGA